MAPIRRYLRITKHSVLEVRIYVDRPSDADNWLLRSDNPVLPRVIEAVRPFVLPKLREENERARGKGKGKKKGVKDVVVRDDFDVSIFLTELSARHSLLTKQKTFKDKPSLESNSSRLTGWLTTGSRERPVAVPAEDDAPIIVGEDAGNAGIVIREEEDEVALDDIPEANEDDQAGERPIGDADGRQSKRRRQQGGVTVVESSDSDEGFQDDQSPPMKRLKKGKEKERGADADNNEAGDTDDKKKLGLNTSYDGFSIYGRILCLVVKRKGAQAKSGSGRMPASSSEQMMENWVSTQAAGEQSDDGDEDG